MATDRAKRERTVRGTLERFHEPLGTLVFCHQLLYQELAEAIQQLMGYPVREPIEQARAVIAHIHSFEARIDLFSQLAHLRFQNRAMTARTKSIAKALNEVNAHRNNIIHGQWHGVPSTSLVLDRQRPRSETYDWKRCRYSPRRIERIATKMWRTYHRLLRFEDRVDLADKKAR